jgi:hypothetical protein
MPLVQRPMFWQALLKWPMLQRPIVWRPIVWRPIVWRPIVWRPIVWRSVHRATPEYVKPPLMAEPEPDHDTGVGGRQPETRLRAKLRPTASANGHRGWSPPRPARGRLEASGLVIGSSAPLSAQILFT